jgi:tRNA threonylcarbamoyl adenosine modification protein (Sua5/YciO/YrdC/YwlC family)
MLLPINSTHPEPRKIDKALEILKGGGIIAYPTGTIYGIGCDILNKKAIEKVYRIKGIDRKKPLSFLCFDLSDLSRYARVDDAAYRIMRRLLPGPYTFILEATKEVPRLVLSKRNSVGIRVPDHPVALAHLKGLESIERKVPELDLILDAGPASARPSTILAITENGEIDVLREGAGPIDAVVRLSP